MILGWCGTRTTDLLLVLQYPPSPRRTISVSFLRAQARGGVHRSAPCHREPARAVLSEARGDAGRSGAGHAAHRPGPRRERLEFPPCAGDVLEHDRGRVTHGNAEGRGAVDVVPGAGTDG